MPCLFPARLGGDRRERRAQCKDATSQADTPRAQSKGQRQAREPEDGCRERHVQCNGQLRTWRKTPWRCKNLPRPRKPGRAQCTAQRHAQRRPPRKARAMHGPAADPAPVAPAQRKTTPLPRQPGYAQCKGRRPAWRLQTGKVVRDAEVSSGQGARSSGAAKQRPGQVSQAARNAQASDMPGGVAPEGCAQCVGQQRSWRQWRLRYESTPRPK